jgi:hypothetical protein
MLPSPENKPQISSLGTSKPLLQHHFHMNHSLARHRTITIFSYFDARSLKAIDLAELKENRPSNLAITMQYACIYILVVTHRETAPSQWAQMATVQGAFRLLQGAAVVLQQRMISACLASLTTLHTVVLCSGETEDLQHCSEFHVD